MFVLDKDTTMQVSGGTLVASMQKGAQLLAPVGAVVGAIAGYNSYDYADAIWAWGQGGQYLAQDGVGTLSGLAGTTLGYAFIGFWAAALVGSAFGALYSDSE